MRQLPVLSGTSAGASLPLEAGPFEFSENLRNLRNAPALSLGLLERARICGIPVEPQTQPPLAHVKNRIRWLQASYTYEPSAWLQLATVLRASGRDSDATRVLIAMQNDRIRRGSLSPVTWFGRQILRVTIGHGYRPWLAGAWATAVIATFAVVVWQASERFVAAKDGVHGTPQPVVYAADTFLPIVDFGQAADWDPTGWTRWVAWAVIAVGWALTTIFVGGFTKLVRTT